MLDNPEYKGPWKASKVSNPDYQGPWVHPQIDNPEYEADDELYMYESFGVIGFDLWQVKSGTIFDNVIITDSIDEAVAFMDETWNNDAEKKMYDEKQEAQRAEAAAAAAAAAEDDDDDDDDEDYDDDDDEDEAPTHEEL
jgi:calreticulin